MSSEALTSGPWSVADAEQMVIYARRVEVSLHSIGDLLEGTLSHLRRHVIRVANVLSVADGLAREDFGLEMKQDLVRDELNVFSEVFGIQTELDEFLLLHQDVIRAIVDDIGAEHTSEG